MGFNALLPAVDAAIAAHLCDPATFHPQVGDDVLAVPVQLEMASEDVLVGRNAVVLDRPMMSIPVFAVAAIEKGDEVILVGAWWGDLEGSTWRFQEKPKKPDEGRWHVGAVMRVGL